MSASRTPRAEMHRLRARLSLAWAIAWFLGIAVFALVTINLNREATEKDLDAELALQATAVYGLTWFDQSGAFHDEILELETELLNSPFDLWVIEPSDPEIVHFGPSEPRFHVEALEEIAGSVVATLARTYSDGVDERGAEYRWHAIPTFTEDNSEEGKAGIIVVGDPIPGAHAHRVFTTRIALLALVLGLLGLGIGMLLARWSLRPVTTAHEQREHFVSAAAHELRTPIATLSAICESALAGDESSTVALQRIAPIVSGTAEMLATAIPPRSLSSPRARSLSRPPPAARESDWR